MISFTVHGTPQPAGSKRAFHRPGIGTRVVDANAKAKPWKAAVAAEAAAAMAGADILRGPVEVEMTFFRARPKGHYGTGRNAAALKPSAPAHWTTKPDALKLGRAVEDALTGVVYADDAQIVTERLAKRWGEPERVEIKITEALAGIGARP